MDQQDKACQLRHEQRDCDQRHDLPGEAARPPGEQRLQPRTTSAESAWPPPQTVPMSGGVLASLSILRRRGLIWLSTARSEGSASPRG